MTKIVVWDSFLRDTTISYKSRTYIVGRFYFQNYFTLQIEEDSDSGESACSDEDTDEPMSPAYHCTPQHSVVTNATSEYFSVLDGGHTTVTDLNEVSRTFDTDGNLVIAAQVEITQQPTQSESSESESGTVCSLNLPLPVIGKAY